MLNHQFIWEYSNVLDNLKKKISNHLNLILNIFIIICCCLLLYLYASSYTNIPLLIIIALFILAIIGSILICFSFKVGLVLNKINTFFSAIIP